MRRFALILALAFAPALLYVVPDPPNHRLFIARQIPAAEDADAIIFDAASNRVFTFNGDAHSSTVIDPRGTLITNIALGGKPEYGASAGDGKVYANLTDTSEVVEIDAKSATVSRRWSTEPCKQPVSMAVDTTHPCIFIAAAKFGPAPAGR